ncbi:F0F1 ATP synthase subunit B family protein [Roseomonas populi]|uniref:ATP synthase subunit b n=1 Tax=Roseomonas populi TaxID=3121582 RepID=A0ABT1X689_9PROT|nr:F0F1 ATP synthase subunit B [Roseomonas pecuniae]MCR0983621.1 F0F1 ATP synthase subunit B [Roseomonas pecuniae]
MHHYEHFWLDPKFWVAVSFVVFLLLLGRTMWSKAAAALDARGAQVRAELAEATKLREEAEAMRKQAEADRAAALREAEEMVTRARTEADRVAAAATAEAEANAARRERMAMDRIAAAEASALAEVRQAAAEIAAAAARSVIAEKLTAEGDAAMVDKAVSDLPRALRAA